MDPIRRNILTTGAAAAATAAAPRVFAQAPGQAGAFKFYEKGNVRIRYQEVGTGFPLLVTPGRGLNSRISNRPIGVQHNGGIQERLPPYHDGPARRHRRRIHRPPPERVAFAEDGPSVHAKGDQGRGGSRSEILRGPTPTPKTKRDGK